MTYQLRRLAESDQSFVSDLYQDPLIMRHIGDLVSPDIAAQLCHKMLQEIERQTADYQIIETTDGLHRAGMLSMHWYPHNESIESGMIVVPAYQNKGVCKWAQMNAMRQVRRLFPAKLCTVYIHADNKAASISYQNMGFVPVKNTSTAKKHLNLVRWDFTMEKLNQ